MGDVAVFVNSPAEYDALALSDSRFCTLSSQDMHELLRSYPELGIKIIADLSQKLSQAETKIESLTLKSAEARLLEALIEYSGGQKSFTLETSKKDIASEIGMRPETLSRSLKKLKQTGQIKVDGKSIQLLDRS